jgi:hypothetical protein
VACDAGAAAVAGAAASDGDGRGMLVAWANGARRGRLGHRGRPPFLAARRGAICSTPACGRRGQRRRRGMTQFWEQRN